MPHYLFCRVCDGRLMGQEVPICISCASEDTTISFNDAYNALYKQDITPSSGEWFDKFDALFADFKKQRKIALEEKKDKKEYDRLKSKFETK